MAKENGIGAAIARRLARDGFIVAVSDVAAAGVENDNRVERAATRWQGLDTLVADIEAAQGQAMRLTGDVSTEAGAESLVSSTINAYGRLDVLVNNAGAPHGKDRNQIEQVPLSAWEFVFSINVTGVFLMSRAAVPHMKAQGYGRIISMASVAGLEALPERAAYCASKAAVIGMTRSLAHDLAPHGITVNCICPGSIRTDRAISSTIRAGVDGCRRWGWPSAPRAFRRNGTDARKILPRPWPTWRLKTPGYIVGQAIAVDGGGLPPNAF